MKKRSLLNQAFIKTNDLIPIIKTLFAHVNGNVVRVQEILKAEYNQEIAYSTLTRLTREMNCRQPPVRFGEYIYEPGLKCNMILLHIK